jgi:hypothetical protein
MVSSISVPDSTLLQSSRLPPMDPSIYILLSSMGAALALLGPGAWSVDARLFGWKRINIQDD